MKASIIGWWEYPPRFHGLCVVTFSFTHKYPSSSATTQYLVESTSFMKLAMELTIADINFVHVLQESDYSSIFQVTVQDKLYVLKVVRCS